MYFLQVRVSSYNCVNIHTHEYIRLPKPSISVNPVVEVTLGPNVGITCSISTQQSGGTFILLKTSGSFRKTQTSSTNSATFSIFKVKFDNEGLYQCQYQTQVSCRDFISPLSDPVRLSINGKEKQKVPILIFFHNLY
uniref:Immunoglobulin-like beta-sandwich domain-containing protein n=1 Tax=Dicentrarchus labrax TaxID=13489 RepID=A0A8C4IEG2_DICLA